MVHLKSKEEIRLMIEGGRRLREVLMSLRPVIKPGVTTKFIDEKADELIIKQGGRPSFKMVKNYDWATCLPVNEQIVHTPPSERILKDGDVLTVDIGMYFQGYHTDFATTLFVGKERSEIVEKFLETGQIALKKAILQANVGKRIGDISQTIQQEIEKNGYKIIKELTGHGIGKELHEDPYIFGFLQGSKDKTLIIKPGLTIAIEIIYSQTCEEIDYEGDWSIRTKDRSLSACFEHTVAVTEDKTIVLT